MRYLSLIRHAATFWNHEGRVQGQRDVPLSAAGVAQAHALGRRFAGTEVVLYTSPLGRAQETAALAFPGQTATPDARLKELNFGVFEGHTLSERLELQAWRTWSADPFFTPAPGGESYRELRERAVAWLDGLHDAPHVVAVTHSGTIQMLLSHALGLDRPRWRKRFYLGHASVTGLVLDGHEIFIERVNDTQHVQNPVPVVEEVLLEP
ncbi:MAG: putative phosphoglycerate mutase [uncultured Truepera sp.]|uniref:Putative phosphoglycerate mutase n=1 Tax=uncultured Truepera sp. TaxID=543023 RepID=A0A6J4UKT8_9DEIN|nr:MAG: putative phosphoglycerate mutase [uncultured Truepera sp.]